MPHDTTLISTIAVGFVLAFVLGALAHRLKLPPLVGYLIAGILVGPTTPGFVADVGLASQLAEIGVILLMFGVGLHFSLGDLLHVRGIAVPGAIVQIAFATLLGWGLGTVMGWPLAGGLVFGLALSVASTVVLLKALQDHRLLETERGKIAIGWLIVEDLAMVLALVIIPALAAVANGETPAHAPSGGALVDLFGSNLGIAETLVLTVFKIVAFFAVMLVVGRKLIPWSLNRIAHMGSKELFRLGVLAIALGVAFGAAKLFGVSLALGAFFAGMILSESALSQRAAQESLPLRDAFAVLFFVSVGMLFDPAIILREPLPVLATLFIIVIGKSVAAFLIVLAFRRTVTTALTISASLAQIGEFSFILAELGVGLNLMPAEARDLILAGAILSIILNPVVFYIVDLIRPRSEGGLVRPQEGAASAESAPPADFLPVGHPLPEAPELPESATSPASGTNEKITFELEPTKLTDHNVLIGYGRVGSIVGSQLRARERPLLVIEETDMRVAILRAMGIETILGNAADPAVLALANLAEAHSLIIAIPETFEAGQIAAAARAAKPSIKIVARAHSDAEVEHLMKFGADAVVMGEREIAMAMIEWVQDRTPEAMLDGPITQDSAA